MVAAPSARADLLAVSLQSKRLPVVRSGQISMRQWLAKGYQFAGDHIGDIVSVIGMLALP